MKQNTKDWIQYVSGVALIASAIGMAFTSFLIVSDVTAGANAYIGIAISGALAVFGVATFAMNRISQSEDTLKQYVDKLMSEKGGQK